MVNTEKRSILIRYGLLLEYATLAWNVIEVGFLFYAAIKSGSVALAGFGIDSLIEIFASVIVVWQLKAIENRREKFAIKSVGIAFFCLAIYIIAQSLYVIITMSHPESSPLGILWLSMTVIAMLLLAKGKSIVGKQIQNRVLQKESKVTLIDASLAGAILIGLILNASLGWWWADIAASFILVYYGLKEGFQAFRE